MSLKVTKNPEETWREAVIRYAKPYKLEQEALEAFDCEIALGTEEARAAFEALYEWDILDLA